MKKIYVVSPHEEERNTFINTHFKDLLRVNKDSIISMDAMVIPFDDYDFIYCLLKDSDIEEWDLYTRIKMDNFRIIKINED